MTFPSARSALLRLRRIADEVELDDTLRLLVEVRASQLNGCSVCLDMHTRELRAAGEPNARIDTIAAWRESPYFTEPERAATINAWNRIQVATGQVTGEWVQQIIQGDQRSR